MKKNKKPMWSSMYVYERCYNLGGIIAKKLLSILLIALVVFQVCLHIPPLREVVSSVYRMDGIPVKENNVKDWYEKLY